MSWWDKLIGRANEASSNRRGGSNRSKPKPKQSKPKSSGGSKPKSNKPTRPTGTASHRGGTSAPVNRRRSDSSSQANRNRRIQQREQKRQTVRQAYQQNQGRNKSGTEQHRFKATVKKWDTHTTQQQKQAATQTVRDSASKLGASVRSATSEAVIKAYKPEKGTDGKIHLTSKTNALGTKVTTQQTVYGDEHKKTLQSGFKYSSRHGRGNGKKTTIVSTKPSEAEIKAHETEAARQKQFREMKLGEYTSDKYKKYQKNRTEEYSKKWDESVRRYIAANFPEKDRKAVYESYMENGGKKDRAKYAKTVADAMTRGMIKGDSEAEIEKIANEHQAGILKSKDLTAEDYLKLQNASRIGGKQGNKALGKDLAEKVGSRTALSASKNTASKISTGVMQGAAYGDVIHGGVGTYNKDARGALKETKDSNAYMGGYMGGFMGGFMLSGASSLGRVAGKEAATAGNALANIARKAAGRNARQLAEEGTESASRVFLRNRLGELIAESPVNVADALKMSKDENGKVNKAEFLTYLGLNTGLTGVMGGAMEGIGMALAKKNATRMAELLGKKKAGGLSEAEGVELDKLAKKITDLHEYSAGAHLEDVKAVRGEAEAKAIADNIVASAAREGIAHDALDAVEAKDYLKLKATKQVKGAKGLTEAENARLKELQDKVTTERVKFEKTLDTVVKDTTEHLQTKATTSAADAADTFRAISYYRSVGDVAKAKEAESVLGKAYKGMQKDLDEISKSSGVKYIAATSDEINQKLLEAGKVGRFGELDNGILIPGKDGKKAIYVNMQSRDAYRVVIGHETTHLLSKSGNFGALKNAVRELGTKMGDYDRLYAEYSELYADEIKGMSKEEARDYIEEEVTAQLVGKYLFNDSSKDFIKSLTKDENVFRQVYDYIVDALKRAIGDGGAPKTEEAKMLQAAKDEFEKAYKEVGGNPESLKNETKSSKGYHAGDLGKSESLSADIRPETVTNGKGKVTREANDAYLKAAESGDIETAQKYVDAVLEARGYTVDAYHGTDTFGFTKFDFKKMFGIDKKNEFLNIFTTKSEDVAGSYTKNQRVRGISEPPKTMEERFRGSDEFASLNKALRKHGARINFDPMLRGDVDSSAQDLLGEALNKAGFKRRIKKPSYDVEYIRKEFGETDVINADEYSKMLTDALNLDAIKETPVETGGIYKAKLKMENPLVVECNGSAWDKINNGFKGIAGESTEGVSNTRAVIKWAKEHKYDSVEFRQIRDLGKYGVKDPDNITTDIYVVFNSNQFKSADAITRDDKGEIIPLKKRGSSSADIRFSKANPDANRESLLSDIEEMYGERYTTDFNETGFIFPDGKLPRMGMDGMRAEDHNIAVGLYDDISYATSYSPKADAMGRFLNEGNIRIMPENGSIEMGALNEPTPQQYRAIREFLREHDYAEIEFSGEAGKSIDSKVYENGVNPDQVINDIKRFYAEGEIGGSDLNNFRFSKSTIKPSDVVDGNGKVTKEADDAYMAAAESGDLETAQKLADVVADSHGYKVKAYRGGIRNVYGKGNGESVGTFFTSAKYIADGFAYGEKDNVGQYYLKLKKPLVLDAEGHSYVDIPVRDTHPDKDLVEYASDSWDYMSGEVDYRSVSADDMGKWANDHNYDGVEIRNVREGIGGEPETDYIVIDPKAIKSADAITRNEADEIIPLGERFDAGEEDVRFSKSKRQKKKDAKKAAEYSEEKANPEILESATADKASAEERLASLTAERDKLEKRQKNIAKYGKQEGKAEKLKTIREDLAGLDEQIATANKEIEKAQKSIDDFARNESAKPKTRKEQTAEKLTAEIEGFKEDIKPIKAEIREKRAELAKLDEVDYSKMPKKEMEAHLAERNALSREINSLQKRIRDLNGEIGSRQKIISKNADNRIKAQKVEAEPVKAPKAKEPKAETPIRERSEVVGDMRKLTEDLEAGKVNEKEFLKRMDNYQRELDVIESGKAPTSKPGKAPKETPKEEPDTSFRETEDFDKYMQSRFKSAKLKDFTNRAIDYGVDVSERVKEFNSLDKEIAALTAKRKSSHTPAHIKEYTEGIEKAEARQTEIAQSVYRDFREAQHRRYANEDVARKEWTPETVSTETESIRTATENIGGVKNFADEVKKVVPKKGSDGKRANKVVTEEMKNPESCLKNYLDGEAAKDRQLQDARASALLENISERLKADPDDTRAMSDLMKVVDKMGEDSTLPTNVRNSAKTLAVATPKGRVGVALRAVDDLNKRYGDRIDGVLKLTDDELEKLATTEPGKELDELYESITSRLWGHIPATFVEKFNEVRHMFMLANIRTHARNIVGNITLRGVRRIADDIEIQLQNKVFREAIEKRGGEVDRVKVRGEEIRENGEYLEAEWEEAYKNSDSVSRWIETNRPDGVPVVKMKALNWMIQADYHALELEDMWTFKPAFKKSYVQYVKAKDAVAQKIIAEGGTAERWDIKSLTEAQKKMARDRAMFDAEYATFRDACLISERLTGIKHTLATKEGKTLLGTGMYRLGNMAMEGVLPFVKTPVNIFRRSIDFSPAKLLWSVGEITSKDPEIFKQGIRDISTGLTGTGVFLLGFLLAETGGISIDTKLGGHSGSKYYDQDMGYQNYSLVINSGGVHQSWTIDWMQPMQSSLFMGAAFRQFFEELRDGDLDLGTNAIAGLFAATSPMFDASFMSGAKDAMEMLMMRSSKETAEGESNMPAAIVQMLAGDLPKNYLSSIVPQAVSQVANLTDNVQRDTRSTLEDPLLASWDSAAKQIVSRVPVLRKYWLNPKLDRRGDDKVTGGNIATRMFNTLINPSTVKEINEDKYDRELIRLRGTLEPGSWQYKNFYYPFTGNPDYNLANGKRMTYDQLYEYGKANRKEMTMDIRHMMDSPSYKYKAMTDEMRTDEINAIYDIGKMAGDYSLGVNYALKAMRKSTESRDKGDTKIFDAYKENAGGAVDKKKFWQWRMDKERAMARAHSDTDDTYRMKGLFAIASGDDNLVDAVDLEGQKEPELRKYWKAVKKDAQKAGKKARILAFEEMTDAGCKIMSNVAEAGLDTANLGVKSVAAGKVANDDKQISERVYRAYGHFWNSAQAGGGLRLKYNDKNDKYSVKNIDKYERELKKRLDDVPEGATKKDVVMDFIENDIKVTNKDEAACLYQVLYIKGDGNPAKKAHWKNPYKEVIDDHLKWGENQDEVYSGSGKGGWGHRRRGGWGHGGWGHGGGGSGGSGGGIGAMLPDAPKAVKASKNYGELPKANFSQAKGTKAKVTDTYAGSSDFTKPSNLNDAYRKRAKKTREALRKNH